MDGSPTQITLSSDLRVAQCEGLRDRLLAALAADGPITIDARRVRFSDLMTLQVLWAFTKEAREAAREVR